VNPVNDFDTFSPDLSYPADADAYGDEDPSTRGDESVRGSQTSFWESPTAAQEALTKITKRPD
jgi:hypothetical protein